MSAQAGKAASRAAGQAASRAAGQAASRAAGKAASRAAGQAASRAAGQASSRAAGKAASRAAGQAASRAAGQAASRAAGQAASRAAGKAAPAPGVLYITATPIGNLGDTTYRAVEILRSVDVVVCEDTRRTRALLTHFDIHARLLSCRAANEAVSSAGILALLREGKSAAYVSDAGTPAMSDPGCVLTREAAEAGFAVVPAPGPSAFTALVSASGGLDKTVLFEGFLSPKPGRRRTRLTELLARGEAFVVYESAHRAIKLAEDLADLDRERYVCVGREMTKVHEEYLRGSAAEVLAALQERSEGGRLLGEFAVFVSAKRCQEGAGFCR